MLLGLLIGGFFALGTITSADCQTIYFPENQSFCFDIKKIEAGEYRAEISNNHLTNPRSLNCNLTLPNKESLSLPRCQGTFKYQGNNGEIKLRAEIPNYRYELITNYDFIKGSFSSFSVLPESSTDYQPEITAINPASPRVNERVDVSVRIKTPYTSPIQHGTLKFRVEEFKNGQRTSSPAY